jgi:vacuolar-type H+-ATPase subunit H
MLDEWPKDDVVRLSTSFPDLVKKVEKRATPEEQEQLKRARKHFKREAGRLRGENTE